MDCEGDIPRTMQILNLHELQELKQQIKQGSSVGTIWVQTFDEEKNRIKAEQNLLSNNNKL